MESNLNSVESERLLKLTYFEMTMGEPQKVSAGIHFDGRKFLSEDDMLTQLGWCLGFGLNSLTANSDCLGFSLTLGGCRPTAELNTFH